MDKKLKINWNEVGSKFIITTLIIFTLKYFLVNVVNIEFRENETLSMGGVIIGIVFVSMLLEYLKGFTIIGKGDGKGNSIILGIGVGIIAESFIKLVISILLTSVIFIILNGLLEMKREKERVKKEEKRKLNKRKKKKRK